MPSIKQIVEAFVYWRQVEQPDLQEMGTPEEVAKFLLDDGGNGEQSSIIIGHAMDARDWLEERGLLPND